MGKKQQKPAKDNTLSSQQPRPTQETITNKRSSNVPRLSQQSASHNAPSIRLPSTTTQPFPANGSSQISYHAVPPPASLTIGFPHERTRKSTKHSTGNAKLLSSGLSNFIESPTLHSLDSIAPSVSLAVLGETPRFDGRFSSDMNIDLSIATADSVRPSDYSLEYMQRLRSLVASKTALEKTGYVLQPLSEGAIERKKRCERCGKTMLKGKVDGKGKKEGNTPSLLGEKRGEVGYGQQIENERSVLEDDLPSIGEHGVCAAPEDVQSLTWTTTPIRKPVIRCRYHGGVVINKVWSCCDQHMSSGPCQAAEDHVGHAYLPGQLERLWEFNPTPSAYTSQQLRDAVAIDCEMGTAKSGDSELIRVTVIDYFSSVVLVDKLVYPDAAMEHYNTRFSGVTRKDMENARARGQCLMGKKMAREAVWRFVGPDTVVVGHSAHNDLTAMRWIHTVVVDTWLLESDKQEPTEVKAKAAVDRDWEQQQVPHIQSLPSEDADGVQNVQPCEEKPKKKVKGSGPLSLKTLTRERLRREIQTAGRKGHDSLEDAIATRDLAHWSVLKQDS